MQDSEGGNDILTGGAGASTNFLYGDAEVHLSGLVTCGNDRLISDTGNDAMWGDIASSSDGYSPVSLDLSQVTTSKDVFVFSANNSQDIIHDFRQDDNDKIELHQMGVLSFDALNRGDHLEEVMDTDTGNMNTVLTFDTNTIIVLGVTGLTADDFLFS